MDFKTFFDTSRAQLRQGKPAQVKLGRVERHRPAGLIHTNTRSPACGGLYWYSLSWCSDVAFLIVGYRSGAPLVFQRPLNFPFQILSLAVFGVQVFRRHLHFRFLIFEFTFLE